jgi:hypothetical protein
MSSISSGESPDRGGEKTTSSSSSTCSWECTNVDYDVAVVVGDGRIGSAVRRSRHGAYIA